MAVMYTAGRRWKSEKSVAIAVRGCTCVDESGKGGEIHLTIDSKVIALTPFEAEQLADGLREWVSIARFEKEL